MAFVMRRKFRASVRSIGKTKRSTPCRNSFRLLSFRIVRNRSNPSHQNDSSANDDDDCPSAVISPPNVYSIHSLLNPNQYQRLSLSSSRSNSAELSEQKHLTNEQIEFLEKFFKENPWADQAQLDAIVKATGLNETMIKVRRRSRDEGSSSDVLSLQIYLEQRRMKWNQIYANHSNPYFSYHSSDHGNSSSMKNEFDSTPSEISSPSLRSELFLSSDPHDFFCSAAPSAYPSGRFDRSAFNLIEIVSFCFSDYYSSYPYPSDWRYKFP